MAFSRAWNETSPADTDLANTLGSAVRHTKQDVAERIDVEHHFPATDSALTGKHRAGSARIFTNPSSSPPLNDVDVPGALWRASDTGAVKIDIGGVWIDLLSITGMVPSGLIAMWAGTLATIPAGWVLCNGSNGTPDLRDKFVKGAPAGAGAGGTGGSLTHTHTLSGLAHTHGLTGGTTSISSFNVTLATGTGFTIQVASPSHIHTTSGNTASGAPSSAAAAAANGEPPFYKILFIMKL